jgi:catechol 2,3-dioxygenase-like lactoylglutathione lyase family enzyme
VTSTPDFDGFYHVGLTVTCLDAEVETWTSVFGAGLVRRVAFGGPATEQVTGVPGAQLEAAVVELDGLSVELLQYQSPQTARPAQPPNAPGSMHCAIYVRDIDATVAALEQRGWAVRGAIAQIRGGAADGNRTCYMVTPDGHLLEMTQRASTRC